MPELSEDILKTLRAKAHVGPRDEYDDLSDEAFAGVWSTVVCTDLQALLDKCDALAETLEKVRATRDGWMENDRLSSVEAARYKRDLYEARRLAESNRDMVHLHEGLIEEDAKIRLLPWEGGDDV